MFEFEKDAKEDVTDDAVEESRKRGDYLCGRRWHIPERKDYEGDEDQDESEDSDAEEGIREAAMLHRHPKTAKTAKTANSSKTDNSSQFGKQTIRLDN